MDRNSITGLLIIGAVLIGFSIWNASSADQEIEKEKVTNVTKDSTKEVTAEEVVAKDTSNTATIATPDSLTAVATIDSSNTDSTLNTNVAPESPQIEEEFYTLENDLIKVVISNKGGDPSAVYLKEFKTYDAYVNERDEPLRLFDEASNFGITFFEGDAKKYSNDYDFQLISKTESQIQLKMVNPKGKNVIYTYSIAPGNYHMDFGIGFEGFDQTEANKIAFEANYSLLSTEKYLGNERRIATLFYKYSESGYDWLSVGGDDKLELEEKTDWVAFKQSYFSAILMKDGGFSPKNGSSVEVINTEDSSYVKAYSTKLNLDISNLSNTTELTWYYGPNNYDILATYENGSEDIVDLGWGLFRWINVYFIRPLFNTFIGWGISAGLAILLLTILVKLLLSPVNYKMYKSSAMMRVLKPEIEKLNQKFPKKEDAMKKQQAVMGLYRETGVNPLSGCVPMLIQMPILFAIFRLFPSSLALRQQSFLWAEDLSSYDAIFSWTTQVPLLSSIYGNHVSLFTLLMAATTLLYTHYNAQNMQQPQQEGMPNMQVIMYIFPVLMIFFFNSYSSGLSYYYFISTLMTILIMWAIKKFIIDEDKIKAKIEENRANPGKKKKKSKFAQRLEEAAKMQQERAAQQKRK